MKPTFLKEFREALESSTIAILSAETGDRESARKRTIEIAERESLLSELEIVRGCRLQASCQAMPIVSLELWIETTKFGDE